LNEEPEEKPITIRMILKKVNKSADTAFGLLVKGYKLDFETEPSIGNMKKEEVDDK